MVGLLRTLCQRRAHFLPVIRRSFYGVGRPRLPIRRHIGCLPVTGRTGRIRDQQHTAQHHRVSELPRPWKLHIDYDDIDRGHSIPDPSTIRSVIGSVVSEHWHRRTGGHYDQQPFDVLEDRFVYLILEQNIIHIYALGFYIYMNKIQTLFN